MGRRIGHWKKLMEDIFWSERDNLNSILIWTFFFSEDSRYFSHLATTFILGVSNKVLFELIVIYVKILHLVTLRFQSGNGIAKSWNIWHRFALARNHYIDGHHVTVLKEKNKILNVKFLFFTSWTPFGKIITFWFSTSPLKIWQVSSLYRSPFFGLQFWILQSIEHSGRIIFEKRGTGNENPFSRWSFWAKG